MKELIRKSPEWDPKSDFLPFVNPETYQTESGVVFLQEPGVAVVSIPHVDLRSIQGFLNGFSPELGFSDYLDDTTPLASAESLCKLAGQLCYLSLGPSRTLNSAAEKYFQNVKESGHGSILEHANFSLLLWGVSRSFTHELVRHRAGFGFSQVSQRYVGGKTLRFVERPEFSSDPILHQLFLSRIDSIQRDYESMTEYLLTKQAAGSEILGAERKTDLRKKVRQAARALLPNETEAPILVTANVRSWRHFINMRANEHAEVETRRVAFEIYRIMRSLAPILFGDFQMVHLSDGTHAVSTPHPKV